MLKGLVYKGRLIMSRGINKVILLGNIGQEPELKRFNNGGCVSNISLATSSSWNDKRSGEKKEITEWHKLVFSGKSAEILVQYCRKGSKLFVEGRLQTRKWQNQSGHEQYTTEIKVSDFKMLDTKQNVIQSKGTFDIPAQIKDQNISEMAYSPNNEVDWDDDIPF